MNGIDISRYQKGINLNAVPCDFVIVKATQGVSYISPTFKAQIEDALKNKKHIGVYHYCAGGGFQAEAEHFLNVVRDYIGRAILVLDWEGEQNKEWKNHAYAVEWLKYVYAKTGIKSFIYMSKSVCREYKAWDASFPLWCAQYKNKALTGYQESPWTDSKGFGPWKAPLIYQYSSTGRLPGYSGNLDLDKAYMPEWSMYCKPYNEPTKPAHPTLKKGSRGDDVKALQALLNVNGYECAIDGIYGNQTENCVRFFQADHIETCKYMDGICGPLTWAALTL